MPEREYEGFTPDPDGFTPDPPASSSSWTDDIFTIPNALRFGGSALGTVAGGLATGGLGAGAGMFAGGAAGEAAARWWEGKDFDPSITALEGALNLLPGGGAIPGKGAALKQVGKYALRQAGHGAWQGAAGSLPRHQAEAGNLWNPSEWEMPSAREIGTQTVAGGVIGGGTGGTLGAAASRFGKARPAAAPPPLDVPTSTFEHPPIRETFTRPPDTSARDIGEGESILDYISADQPVQRAAPIEPVTQPPIQPQGAFDPNSLTGLRRTEVEFVDPTTGEVRSSADARPGDVPVMNEPAAPAAPKPTVESWMDELIRGESGEFDPNAILRNLTGRGEEPTQRVERPEVRSPEGLQVDIQNLGLDNIDMNQLPNSVYYYSRQGRQDIVDYLLEQRMWPSFSNLSREEIERHVLNYTRRGQGEIGEWLRGKANARDTSAPTADVPAAAARAARVDPNVVMPDVRTQIDRMGDEFLQRLIDGFEGNPAAYGESGRNAALYGRDVLDERRSRSSTLMDQFAPDRVPPTVPAPAAEPIPDNVPLQRESYAEIANAIRGMTGEEATAYVNENSSSLNPTDIQPMIDELMSESPTSGSRAAVRFLESRLEQPLPPHEQTILNRINEDTDALLNDRARPPRPGSYAQTVEQLSGMTPDEVRAYADNIADDLHAHDIDPLIAELRKSPTEGTRAAIEWLETRRAELRRHGINTGGGSDATRTPSSEGVLPVKPPVEVTPEMRERSRKRLAAIGGAERAEKLISGETVVGSTERAPYRPRTRRGRLNTAEKISPETAAHWNEWGDRQIADHVTPQPDQPGMTIQPEESYFPKHLVIHYRDEQGNPIGYLGTNLNGTGISTLAVSSKLGLRRGKIAFAMLKEAMDRGITEPSGVTSDWTKNLIDRVKKLVRGEEGELDTDAIVKSLNEIMSGVRASKFGQSVGKAVSKFGKSVSPPEPGAKRSIRDILGLEEKMGRRDFIRKVSGSTEKARHDLTKMFGKKFHAQVSAELDKLYGGKEPNADPDTDNFVRNVEKAWENAANSSPELRAMKDVIDQGYTGTHAGVLFKLSGRERGMPDMPDTGTGIIGRIAEELKGRLGSAMEEGSRFISEEEGSVDLGRLRELFQKKQDGTITPEELAEAKAIATEAKSSSAVAQTRTPHTPKVRTEVDIKGNTRVWIDDIEFTARFGPGGPTMHDVMRLEAQIKDPESFKRLAELKGEEYVGMAGPLPEQPKAPPKQITWSDTRKKKPAAATTTPAPAPAPALPRAASLPAELAGAKPRFNIGADSYSPSFADDLDKALFIIAQKTKSKSDAKYLQFVMEQTGLDEEGARLAAQGVRNTIKNQISGQEPGVVRIESIWRKNQEPPAATPAQPPKVTAQEAGNGTVAKAANEKPAAVEATPEQAVAASMEAEAAAASLGQRLKRATENPNPANSAGEIEELLDEAAESINKIPERERAGWIRQVLGGNKALLTAWDLSAPGRQGKAFILNKSWWTSLDDMVKAWGSQKAADTIARSIIDHPSGYFKPGPPDKFGRPTKSYAEKMGLDLAGVEELYSTTKGSAFEKYSGVGRSSRAHTAFLSKLRSDQFVAMVQSAEKLGLGPKNDLNQVKTYAKFINDATGRGSLNVGKWKLERNLGAINDVMFAPKNLSGQIRTWNGVLNPMKYASYDPVMRQQALRSLLAIAGTGLAVGELSRLMGGKIVDEPTSSDFRKIRVGDTRIDLFGGYQQFPVAAMKFLMNAETPTSGRDAGRTINFDKGGAFRNRATVAERFFTNRLSPAGSFVWAWMNNREFDGKPFEVKRALYERTAPIVLKDLYELAKDDPALAAIMTPSNVLGLTGTQTYGRN